MMLTFTLKIDGVEKDISQEPDKFIVPDCYDRVIEFDCEGDLPDGVEDGKSVPAQLNGVSYLIVKHEREGIRHKLYLRII